MKVALFVGGMFLAVALALVAFVAVLRFGASNVDPEADAHLTRAASAEVISSERERRPSGTPQSGYAVEVRYEVDGQWYRTQGWVPELLWTPAKPAVSVCVDPEDPAAVVIPTIVDRVVECGEGNLGRNDEQRATPVDPPR